VKGVAGCAPAGMTRPVGVDAFDPVDGGVRVGAREGSTALRPFTLAGPSASGIDRAMSL
jgi:hypothetical protein